MSLAPGARLGPYENIAAIGAGGMGEVYRAHDSRLERDVAIKVLPAGLSLDAERLQRFEQEARAAAALNHPNILGVHDIGQNPSTGSGQATAPYIVTELLEGETLRDRLTQGPVPARKAIEYAIQIAHGLAAAHERGIVHRDLKPENIFITTDGRVKILDFGLAKLTQSDVGLAGASNLPTTPPQTQDGLVLGTIGYMAPEQVRGSPVSHLADVFAFGAVLYEMLSGQRAFHGATTADTMTAILKEDPQDLPIVDRHIPPALARIVDRCLEKSAVARFHSMHDLAIALETLSSYSEAMPTVAAGKTPAGRWRERLAWVAAGLLLVTTVAVSLLYLRALSTETPRIQFAVSPPPNVTFSTGGGGGGVRGGGQAVPVLSPDGRRIVFSGLRAGQALLWVRDMDALEARPLAGTESPAGSYFWSPDSRTIGFFAGGKLKTIDASGGPVQTLCNAPGSLGGTWNSDGVIVFAGGGLFRVPAAGGQPIPLTKPDATRGETSHRLPFFLPDGRHFLFAAAPTNTVWVGSLDKSEPTKVMTADSQARYSSGYLLFVRQGTLMAQPFDTKRLTPVGDATPIVEQVLQAQPGYAAFSASDSGSLAYRQGAANPLTRLTWFDRAGKPLGTGSEQGRYRNPVLSPDGTRAAVQVVDPAGQNEDIWLLELSRGVMSRFTFDSHNDTYPIWSPDGKWIMYGSDREQNGGWNLYQKLASGAGEEELVRKSTLDERPHSWSPDGRYVVFRTYNPTSTLGVLPLFGDRKPLRLPPGTYGTGLGQVSPDGRWIAYGGQETGRYEVYVRGFPTAGGKWQISKDGAVSPRWRGDSKELFYYAFDGRLMTVSIGGDKELQYGTPTPLFTARMLNGPAAPVNFRAQYDVTRDGQRFLLNVPAEDQAPPSITVVVNWPALLKK